MLVAIALSFRHKTAHVHCISKLNTIKMKNRTLKLITHLEKVVLMHHATVGQGSDQPIGQCGFSTIGHAKERKKVLKMGDRHGKSRLLKIFH